MCAKPLADPPPRASPIFIGREGAMGVGFEAAMSVVFFCVAEATNGRLAPMASIKRRFNCVSMFLSYFSEGCKMP